MEPQRGAGWWYAALGASASSLAIIGVAYIRADAGYWFRYGPLKGWTIYPQLEHLPQTVASTPDYVSNLVYNGLLLAAELALAVSVVCWLVSVGRGLAARQLRSWLPLLLAIPATVHGGAYEYNARQPYNPASHPLLYQLPDGDALENADEPTEAIDANE